MGAGVFLYVDGTDGNFLEGKTGLLHFQQYIGFVFEPVTADLRQLGQNIPGECSQACLGVRQGHAHKGLEHKAGNPVAGLASGRHIRLGKIPDTKDNLFRFQHPQGAGANILAVVLIVAVYGDNALLLRSVFQEPGDGGFQRCTFAPVLAVVQQMDLGMLCGGFEIMQILRFAAVVEQDDIGKALVNQTVDHGKQLLVGIQRGEYDADFMKIAHKKLLSLK